MRLATVIQSHHNKEFREEPHWSWSNKCASSAKVEAFVHVLALELPQLSM
jgi:hypothetical protein